MPVGSIRRILLALCLGLASWGAEAQQQIQGFPPLSSITGGGITSTPQFGGLGIGAAAPASGLAINPTASSLALGYNITQSGSGTQTANLPIQFNLIQVTSDNAAISGTGPFPGFSGPFHNALEIQHKFGGAAMVGGVNSLGVDCQLTAATGNTGASLPNSNRNYVCIFAHAWASSGDGGTGTTNATAKGGLFGSGIITTAQSGATNLLNIQGLEINWEALTGSSGWLKEGLSLVDGGSANNDTVAFTHNVSLTFSKQSGNLGSDTAISLNDYHGVHPLRSIGCVICAESESATQGSWTAATGIDLNLYAFSGNLLNYKNFQVTGLGRTMVAPAGFPSNPPTYTGDLRIIRNSNENGNLNENGGIEFENSDAGGGYGHRIIAPDLGAGSAPLVFQRRNNTATWTEALRIESLSPLVTFSDPVRINAGLGIGTAAPATGATIIPTSGIGLQVGSASAGIGVGEIAAFYGSGLVTNGAAGIQGLYGDFSSGSFVMGAFSNHSVVLRTNNTVRQTWAAGLTTFGLAAGVPQHLATAQTTAPALTSCGTSPAIAGTDTVGTVTMGTGTPTGCVITFNVAYTGTPNCTVTWQATPLASQSYAVTNAAITLTQTATSSNKVNYACIAPSGG